MTASRRTGSSSRGGAPSYYAGSEAAEAAAHNGSGNGTALHAVPASRFIAAPMRRQTILDDVPRRLNGGLRAVMDKRGLSERDICTKFITPALRKAGWG